MAVNRSESRYIKNTPGGKVPIMPVKKQPMSRSNRVAQEPEGGERHKNQLNGRANEHQPDDLRARIVELAYVLYEQRGRRDGHALDDWLEAERQVASTASLSSLS